MPYLQMTGVHKRYGGVVALDGASLSCERGEVHALLGPNGSGKSTLNKVLTGVSGADAAAIELAGAPLRITGPQSAQQRGIAAVYQDLSLVDQLTVADNIALAFEPTRGGFVNSGAVRDRAMRALEPFGDAFDRDRLPVGRRVGELSPGEQQIVEIAKALAREPTLLVLDEATASLRRAQVEVLTVANGDWDQATGQQVMSDLLATYPEIDGVWTQDGMAEGVFRALDTADRLDEIQPTGEARVGYMRLWEEAEGFETIGVVNPPGAAVGALHVAVALLDGEEIDEAALDGNNLYLPIPEFVTVDNFDDVWSEVSEEPDTYSVDEILSHDEILAEYFQ